MLKRTDGAVEIDSLLLSCRVLGRGVEEAFLDRCVQQARRMNGGAVLARYVRTKKNGQVADFYDRRGFSPLNRDENHHVYRLGADDKLQPHGDFFKSIHIAP